MSGFLTVTGVLSVLAGAVLGAAGQPLQRDLLVALAGLQLGGALVLAVARSRRDARRGRAATRAANFAALVGLREGRALTQSLLRDELPAPLTVWGPVMAAGESAHLDIPVHYTRFYGRDMTYRRSSAYVLGGGPGMAFAAGCLMLGDSVERSRAIRGAQPRWRDAQHTRAILTNRRLLVLADNEWVEFAYSQIKAFYPDPWAWRVVLEFAGTCAPLRLTGPATPSAMAYVCWALHGAAGLGNHPGLQPLR